MSATATQSRPAVSVVVVNYEAGRELVQCLETVFAQRFPRDVEVLVVDNASRDNSLLLAQHEFPSLRIIENHENRGFAAALNQGIHATRGEHVLSLNFDVRLDPDFLAAAVEAIESGPRVGSVAGKLFKYRTEDHGVLDSTGITFFQMVPADRGENRKDVGQYERPEPVFGATAAAALYRRAMLRDVAFGEEVFDEDFFMVCEDVDLAWRAQWAGWTCLYAPRATAEHRRGATRRDSEERRAAYYRLGHRNRYLTILKNLHPEIRRRHAGALRRKELRHFLHVWKHHGLTTAAGSVKDAARLYSRMMEKRKAVLAKVRVPPEYIEGFLYV